MAQNAVRFHVNGAEVRVSADGATPLLYVLRNDLKLTGTRFGCGSGHCGSCQVLVDGSPVAACDTPLWSVDGKAVVTVEGMAPAGGLHPLQRAFVNEQAAQCGYCLSGILMSAMALLSKNPDPSDADVRAALDKHLCRCGSHNRMVRAVLRAASEIKVAA